MTSEYPSLSESEKKAIVNLCVAVGFCDGSLSDLERGAIQRMAQNFSGADLSQTLQTSLNQEVPVDRLVHELQSANAKALAYEMAVCVCSADQSINEVERRFLENLRCALGLDAGPTADFQQKASDLRREPPLIAPVVTAPDGVDEMIRDRAIVAGALELLPQRLATMSIIPVQMQMVYTIGKRFGFELDLTHTREFLATVGVGLTSQVVEGYLSKLVGQLARPVVGRFLAGVASQVTESAAAFATTYALGQAAKTYYENGRQLSTAQLREVFSKMLGEGRLLQSRYSSEIAQRAGSLNVGGLLSGLKV